MKILKVEAEHGTTGVWLDGAPIDDLCALGFSSALQNDFMNWSTEYTELACSIPDDSFNPQWLAFNKTGHDLAVRLNRESKGSFKIEHWFYADNSDKETIDAIDD